MGHATISCNKCDIICHKKCSKIKKFTMFRNQSYCQSCLMINDIIKYNPFYSLLQENDSESFFDEEPPEYVENLHQMSEMLEKCRSYTNSE